MNFTELQKLCRQADKLELYQEILDTVADIAEGKSVLVLGEEADIDKIEEKTRWVSKRITELQKALGQEPDKKLEPRELIDGLIRDLH